MKIITFGVISWETFEVLHEKSFEYSGPIAKCKSSGSAPEPTDPYEQASAQYGLATGTANYNAALNRTNNVNPLGSSSWQVTGTDGSPTSASSLPSMYSGASLGGGLFGFGGGAGNGGLYGLGSGADGTSPSYGSTTSPGATGALNGGSGAPLYTESTSLTPWADNLLSSPIDTSQIPGMPGGPSLQQNVNSAENSTFDQQMQLLQPQEQLQTEQNQSQLEGEGAMPGSAAYDYGTQELGRTQGAENAQVADSAVTTGMGELPMFYGLGSTDLQNQLAERSAPISEYEALSGGPSANASAATPDISGAFAQQYQSALAGYNANVATNNANTGAGVGLAGAGLEAYAAAAGASF